MNALPDTSTVSDHADAAALREAMVTELRTAEDVRSDTIARAFAAVPRHVFAPEEPLERAYATQPVLQPKRDERGVATSMISAPDRHQSKPPPVR